MMLALPAVQSPYSPQSPSPLLSRHQVATVGLFSPLLHPLQTPKCIKNSAARNNPTVQTDCVGFSQRQARLYTIPLRKAARFLFMPDAKAKLLVTSRYPSRQRPSTAEWEICGKSGQQRSQACAKPLDCLASRVSSQRNNNKRVPLTGSYSQTGRDTAQKWNAGFRFATANT